MTAACLLAHVCQRLFLEQRVRPLDVRHGLFDSGFPLLDGRPDLGDPRFLLATVEPSKHGAHLDAIAVVGAKLYEGARRFEANARENLRLDRPQTKDLDRHVLFGLDNLHGHRPKQPCPYAGRHHGGDQKKDCE
jgi:hypothetical protein